VDVAWNPYTRTSTAPLAPVIESGTDVALPGAKRVVAVNPSALVATAAALGPVALARASIDIAVRSSTQPGAGVSVNV
jgi:hypothetical protein